jgi:hypothetical protein
VVSLFYNFNKTEETSLRLNNREKITEHGVRHKTGIGKNTNGASIAPVDGKGLRK